MTNRNTSKLKSDSNNPASGKIEVEKVGWGDARIVPVVWLHDNDTIASVCFDELNLDSFYLVTFSGVLEIWSLTTLRRVAVHNVGRQCNKVFSFNGFIIVCCERMILTLKTEDNDSKIRYIKEMSAEYDGIITDCCLSKTLRSSQCEPAVSSKH
jgi:hypothetical protein